MPLQTIKAVRPGIDLQHYPSLIHHPGFACCTQLIIKIKYITAYLHHGEGLKMSTSFTQ